MDLLHGILHYILKRNYLAPIHKPRAILDVGTGTGIWVREMATLFPKARVVGLDALDLIRWNGMPKNATFHFADLAQGLPFPDGSFDYVHYRTSYTHLLHNGHMPACRELHRLCRSTGWVEVVDIYRRLQNRGPCGERLDNFIAMVLADRGEGVDRIHRLSHELGAAGFIDVTQRVVSLPVGDWGGAPGTLVRRATEMLMRALADDVVRLAGDAIDHTQYEALVDCFLEETERRQTYMEVYCFTGRRP
ncbi:S-adenosyl-L-methionine-dependent methyltransferase [Syncephalis pseudoplumigaleata]|uniref:S-adenosyl-L-methionine-dependent methyltransferase n=1 Tax=Syncephalis pseudoplumigaleata TaxID=1712513 RepID=A0A4P9Z0F9_9FUNG|nr:S-adenosyl-L-methionine-dependent methyltransferase [Syncephalis pseudoplumigaleata]|eukprot:RKP25352.1 S-adenosyl-L-methionine-dependent methyltransferase [Syncephalis pseudoplumigaleata]